MIPSEAEARRTIDKLKRKYWAAGRATYSTWQDCRKIDNGKAHNRLTVAANSCGASGHAKELERAGFYHLPEDSKDMDPAVFRRGKLLCGTEICRSTLCTLCRTAVCGGQIHINFRDYLNATPEAAKRMLRPEAVSLAAGVRATMQRTRKNIFAESMILY